MSLNLIKDPWIPVRCKGGTKRVIAPWQMAESDVLWPDWARPDQNVACLELLIGLVFMADPPADKKDWRRRQKADAGRLKEKLEEYAPAFFLLGDGPRFLQDWDELAGEPNPVDMLFIDSAGTQTMKNNIDVMVHRRRYQALSQAEAAMALYTLQDFAPSGGAGNRTSMRGGGPLVTLLEPVGEPDHEVSLWERVWFNVPFGEEAFPMADLPWMKPTRTSEKGTRSVLPGGNLETEVDKKNAQRGFNAEAFLGMPRRLRLVSDENGLVTGVVQRPYGTNYDKWRHPLSPYYQNPGAKGEMLPCHPKPGHFGYRNWLGILAKRSDKQDRKDSAFELAQTIRDWQEGHKKGEATVLVAGWAMSNMTPREFIYSRQPLQRFSDEAQDRLVSFIEAANDVANMLSLALKDVLGTGEVRDAQREEFYRATESGFLTCFRQIAHGDSPGEAWLKIMRTQALRQFDALTLQGIADCDMSFMKKIVEARSGLKAVLWGYGKKMGPALFGKLELPVPEKKRKAA